jgi:hypothetical protein
LGSTFRPSKCGTTTSTSMRSHMSGTEACPRSSTPLSTL